MTDDDTNPNIEWKKDNIGEQERFSRKIDVQKAVENDAKKDSFVKKAPVQPKDLPLGLKKIQKKIRSLDDEDDDENVQFIVDPLLMNQSTNSLYNALNEDERKILKQNETNDLIKQQLNTEKLSAVNTANNLVKKAGFSGLKKDTLRQSINDINISPKKIQQTLQQEFKKDLKKTNEWEKLDDKDLLNLMQGINKIKQFDGKESKQTIKDLEIKEVVEIGKNADKDKKAAQTICEKTGRNKFHTDKDQKKNEEKILINNKNKNKAFAKDRERD